MAPSWLNCNLCLKLARSSQPPPRMLMTSCGKVVCEGCAPALRHTSCQQCNGPCTRTVPLGRGAPKEVLDLFCDPIEKLKEVFKIMSFQENQKAGLLKGKREVKGKFNEKKERGLKQLHELNNALAQKTALMKEFERQECKYRDAMNSLTGGGGEVLSRRGIRSPLESHCDGISRPAERENFLMARHEDHLNVSRSSCGSSGGREARSKQFLQMKTPAAWKTYKHDSGAATMGSGLSNGLDGRSKRPSPAIQKMIDMRSRHAVKSSLPVSNMLISPPLTPRNF